MQVVVARELASWRKTTRGLLAQAVPPDAISWAPESGEQGLLALDEAHAVHETGDSDAGPQLRVPRAFLDLARRVLCHRDAAVFALLYSALWRIAHGESQLLSVATDPLVRDLDLRDKEIRRDVHKMHAFVRFREVDTARVGDAAGEGSDDALRIHGTHFVAWFEPSHLILPLTARFFRDRFAGMNWTILTPDACVSWDGADLHFLPGIPRPVDLAPDRLDEAWRTYYAHIFNPARLKISAMKREMPVRYWRNLPEATLIAPLIAAANARVGTMLAHEPSPARAVELQTSQREREAPLAERIARCTACPLHAAATQAVPGRGPRNAGIALVGEQPGDEEDLAGEPFVGPSGRLLRRALDELGVDPASLFMSNVVKHFSFVPRGKRRLHKTPTEREIAACEHWLHEELNAVDPRVIVCLGRTAHKALMPPGADAVERGEAYRAGNGRWFIHTYHPAFALRSEPEGGVAAYTAIVEALRLAVRLASEDMPVAGTLR